MKIKLVSWTVKSEEVIEAAAKQSRKSPLSKTVEERRFFIKGLIGMGHLSVLRHASATFKIENISRACSHQLVRYSHCNITQESQRYVEFKNLLEIVVPHSIQKNYPARQIFNEINTYAITAYRKLLKVGVPREDARYVLPNCAPTSLYATANFQQWRFMIIERCIKQGAQWEIHELLWKIKKILAEKAPSIFDSLGS